MRWYVIRGSRQCIHYQSLGNASFLPNVGDTRSHSTGCPMRVYPALSSIPIIYRVSSRSMSVISNVYLQTTACSRWGPLNRSFKLRKLYQLVTNLVMSFDVDIESYASHNSHMQFLPSRHRRPVYVSTIPNKNPASAAFKTVPLTSVARTYPARTTQDSHRYILKCITTNVNWTCRTSSVTLPLQ